jgi:hypothetical protein
VLSYCNNGGLKEGPALKPIGHTRRALLLAVPMTPLLRAAQDFWNRKQPIQWSEDEINRLVTRSPWAKEVTAQFDVDVDYTTNGKDGPQVGRSGIIEAPGANKPQIEYGDAKKDQGGQRHAAPVTVRWESSQAIRDALGTPLADEFRNRYVIAVTGLPIGIMGRRRRAAQITDGLDNSPETLQRRMLEELSGSATLSARGKEPAQPGTVRPLPKNPGTYLFGFSKDLIQIAPTDREVAFALQTALMTVKAKFEPREMVYRGKLDL